MYEFSLATRRKRLVTELAGADAAASPGAQWVAYVTGGAPNEDFIANPELEVIELDGEEVTSLGPGFSPLWHPDGRALAWLRPIEERACSEEVCTGRVEVWTAAPGEDGHRRLAAGGWSLLAWAAERVIVADTTDGGRVLAVGPDGSTDPLGLMAPELWDASPDGRWLLTVRGRRSALVPLSGGGREVPLQLDGRFGPGAWSPDGRTVAGAVIGGGGPDRLALLHTSSPASAPSYVDGSEGAAGGVVWAADASYLAFVRARGNRFEALVCPLAAETCRPAFDWREGIALLGLR